MATLVPIGELHQGEELEEEVKTYEPPKCAKRVYQSKEKDLLEDDEDLPSITLIRTRNYTNVNKITEHWSGVRHHSRWSCDSVDRAVGSHMYPVHL